MPPRPYSTLNLRIPLPLEQCRQRLQALQEAPDTGWQIKTELWRGKGGSYEFRIWRIPAHLPAPRHFDLAAEGILRAGQAGESYLLGKLKGQFMLLEELSLREIVVLVSLLVILSLGLRQLGQQISFGVVGLLLALAFVGWRRLNFEMNRVHLRRQIMAALGLSAAS